MTNEVTIPLLPCASIDEIAAFYEVLGFHTTYRQRKPNPYVALRREDLNLHFFEIAGFDPEQSYGSCLVLTSDTGTLYRAFAVGMRAAYGKVLVSGTPRMTRPRARRNAGGLSGFSVVDPGGNWIRITQDAAVDPPPAPTGRLAKALANAVVQADSRGDARQAARILDSVLARSESDDDPAALVEVLVYRAEVAMVLHDPATAAEMLARVDRVALTTEEARRAAAALETAADLAVALT
ncbi:VOC family protein [Micromonospora sp. KC207]|uniref:VOC family protein n=1 Tax=Micromonospora sp. KC207 TaxID=2530377 RepID=UPI001046180D|nr:VOC family protein [Micromonospora sp. KC207]TDC61264.1 VOC family protein [Micromonospora sp. KC207]